MRHAANRWTRWALAGLAGASLWLASDDASAQDPADATPSHNVAGAVTAGVAQPSAFWSGSGPTRLFVAATFDVGVVHFSPTMIFGYGKPHWRWFGAEANSAIAASGSSLYAGVFGAVPGFSARIGVRYHAPVDRFFLPPQEEYVREELETQVTGQSRYTAIEGELTGSLPVPGGSAFAVLSGWAIGEVPDPYYVFEESLKVVVAPPWLWRARLGYLLHVGWQGSMKIGGAAEVIHVPRRNALLVRAGPLITASLTHHLDATAGVMIVAASPDQLGVVGADLAQLGLSYRWATGDRWPDFP